MLQRLLVWFFTLTGRVFFRRIEVTGRERMPPGAVILLGNHPNSLLDPLLIATTVNRPLAFAAKDGLFRQPGVGWIVRNAGGVSVQRRQDHGDVDNKAAFAALDAVLEAGGAFGIFPEGISHTGPELAPLKTGAARIALGAAARGVSLHVVPVGLTYWQRERMRSKVLVHYGAPIPVLPPPPPPPGVDPDEHLRDVARVLTARFEAALRGVTVNAPDFETQRGLDVLRSVVAPADAEGRDLRAQAEAARAVAEVWEARKDDPEMQALLAEAQAHARVLTALDLDGDVLRDGLSRRAWILRLARHALLLLVWLPLALPGIVLHAPPLLAAVLFGRRLSPRDDVQATTKMMMVTFFVLVTYLVLGLAIGIGLPFGRMMLAAGWGLVAVMLSGWAAVRVLERQSTLRHAARVTRQLWSAREVLAEVRAERAAMRARFEALAEGMAEPAPVA